LGKISILAGIVYEPETDSSRNDELKKLSNQINILVLIDELQVLQQNNNLNATDVLKRVTEMTKCDLEDSANYSKILGWTKQKALKMKLLREP